MTKRKPYIEVVRTDAGFHNRVVGGNGEIVWTTEVLTRRVTATEAIGVLYAAVAGGVIVNNDERTDHDDPTPIDDDETAAPDGGDPE